MGKEGLIVVKELKRLQSNFIRLDRFISSHVSRLLKSDLVAVLVELQRQNQVFLCMKVCPLLASLLLLLYLFPFMTYAEFSWEIMLTVNYKALLSENDNLISFLL